MTPERKGFEVGRRRPFLSGWFPFEGYVCFENKELISMLILLMLVNWQLTTLGN